MGALTVLLPIFAVLLIISGTDGGPSLSDRCPPPSKVYGCKPVCRDQYDCKGGKVCCTNSCHTKSCAEPAHGAAGSAGAGGGDKYQSGGPGVYCGNVKCSAYQKCVADYKTGKLVCK